LIVSASFSAMGGAGVCGIEFLWIYLVGIVDICIGRVMYFRPAMTSVAEVFLRRARVRPGSAGL